MSEVNVEAEVTFVIKGLTKLDLDSQTIEIQATILINLIFDPSNEMIDQALVSENIGFRLGEIGFKSSDLDPQMANNEKGCRSFTIRFSNTVPFTTPHAAWKGFPFEDAIITLNFKMTSFYYLMKIGEETKQIKVRFNMRSPPTTAAGISFKQDFDRLCHYDLSLGDTEYTVKTEEKRNKEGKVVNKYAPEAELKLRLVRDPNQAVVAVLAPLFLLNCLTFACFFVNSTDTRFSTAVSMILSIFVLLSWAHSTVPFPLITSMDWMIVGALVMAVLLGFEAVLHNTIPSNVFIIISAVIFGLSTLYWVWKLVAYHRFQQKNLLGPIGKPEKWQEKQWIPNATNFVQHTAKEIDNDLI
eukprot:c5858_g1_i1.p1 GENE.c5858_g1_i1~~c5858_g1_i1.p1  ORF type:complete len:369 (+),score=74.36 c5858_g1_i1:41-1108(+)